MINEIISRELETFRQEILQMITASSEIKKKEILPLEALENNAKTQGISALQKNISTSSVAYAIAQKIAQNGTKNLDANQVGFIAGVVTPERIQQIIDKASVLCLNQITGSIIQQLKEIKP